MQGKAGHLRAAGLVGRDHAVGAGALELLLRALDRRARDDRDVVAQLTCRQGDEDVLRVGVRAGDDRPRPLDARRVQDGIVGGVAFDVAHARPGTVAVLRVGVDDRR